MREPSFGELQKELLANGVTPSTATRIVFELRDHFEDLKLEAANNGFAAKDADTYARRRLGTHRTIAQQVTQRTELKTWMYRYPTIARLYLPVACVLLLPVAPIFAGATHAARIARWSAALMLSAAVTCAMLLAMQLSITLT